MKKNSIQFSNKWYITLNSDYRLVVSHYVNMTSMSTTYIYFNLKYFIFLEIRSILNTKYF